MNQLTLNNSNMSKFSLLEKIKSDPVLKSKVIKASIFFGLFIIVIIAISFSQGKDQKIVDADNRNQISGRIIPADTSSIGSTKDAFYVSRNQDSVNNISTNNQTVLGGSVTQKQENQNQADAALNEYMANRQKSVNRMQNSGNSDTYTTPTRRSYNPNGNAQDWTSEKTSVSSDYSVNKSSNLENLSSSYPTTPLPPQEQNQVKVLTKEEKLQQAIANKYNSTSSSSGPISVVATIYNDQKINGQNTSVRLLLKDKIYVNNATIGTDAFIYGIATVNGSNIVISVPTISYKGKNYTVNLSVYDYRTGEKGIPIKNDNIVGSAQREGENQATQELGRYAGRIGNVITSVLSSRNKNSYIFLSDGHKVYLKSN